LGAFCLNRAITGSAIALPKRTPEVLNAPTPGALPRRVQGRCPNGFWFHRKRSPKKVASDFSNPCACRPSLASDASGVLANDANNLKSILKNQAKKGAFQMIETNRTQLIGFLGADSERKENGNGNNHLVLSVATTTSWKKPNSEDWEKRTEWHRVVVWGKQASRLNLSKGDKVLVVGEIRYREYEDEVSKGKTKIDVKRRLAEIHASSVEQLYRTEKAEAAE
jgi:single-strand DNA-binding protein